MGERAAARGDNTCTDRRGWYPCYTQSPLWIPVGPADRGRCDRGHPCLALACRARDFRRAASAGAGCEELVVPTRNCARDGAASDALRSVEELLLHARGDRARAEPRTKGRPPRRRRRDDTAQLRLAAGPDGFRRGRGFFREANRAALRAVPAAGRDRIR